jgi:long-chain acyl-CoA synthetase
MNALKRTISHVGMSIKRVHTPVLANIVDSTILSAVRDQTGGQLRYTLSGGAAIFVETQEFLTVSLVQILQGGPFWLVP